MKVFSKGGFLGLAGVRSVISFFGSLRGSVGFSLPIEVIHSQNFLF